MIFEKGRQDMAKMEPRIRVGQEVGIYHDPITQVKFEGEAVALEFVHFLYDGQAEMWKVKFTDEAAIYERQIYLGERVDTKADLINSDACRRLSSKGRTG